MRLAYPPPYSPTRRDFQAETHFEATRSLGAWAAARAALPAAPAPAVGNAAAVPDLGEAVRGEFPGLAHHADAVFADGASGSQVVRPPAKTSAWRM